MVPSRSQRNPVPTPHPDDAPPHASKPMHVLQPRRAIAGLAAGLCGLSLSFLSVLSILSGCAGTPSTALYALDAPRSVDASQNVANIAAYAASPVIIVLPAEIPSVLDRPQMVLRDGENRLIFSEYHRWAAPLREEVARVVADELGHRLRSNGVVALPFVPDDMRPDYRLTLIVRRFDARIDAGSGHAVTLDAQWQLKPARGEALVGYGLYEEMAATATSGKDSHAALAAAHARALRRLADDIARMLRQPAAQRDGVRLMPSVSG